MDIIFEALAEKSQVNVQRVFELAVNAGFNLELKQKIVGAGANPNFAIEDNLTILAKAFKDNDRSAMDEALLLGASKLIANSELTFKVPGIDEEISQEQLTRTILNRLNSEKEDEAFSEASQFFKILRSPFQLYLYTEALQELRNINLRDMGFSFHQIATNMLYIEPAKRPINVLLSLFSPTEITAHPNEADILLLLNDPESPQNASLPKNKAWSLVKPKSNEKVDSSAKHWALSRIGSQTYSFPRWRFEAQSAVERKKDGEISVLQASMLELFGGTRVASSDVDQMAWNKQFGTQFVFPAGSQVFKYETRNAQGRKITNTFDKQTSIIMRQGYLLIHNPNKGLLLIRNSSPEFGRSLLPQTSYFVPVKDAKLFSDNMLLNPFPYLFTRAINPININNNSDLANLNYLLDEVIGFEDALRLWKFNTKDTNSVESQGFKFLIKHLEFLEYSNINLERSYFLGFVHPDFPSWRHYPYHD